MSRRDRYKHLRGAMRLAPDGDNGLCFHRAAGFVLDRPGATLAIGTIRAATDEEAAEIRGASREAFIHAWAEIGDKVFAPTTIERAGYVLRPVEREVYYSINGVSDVHYLERPRLLRLSRAIGLAKHLLTGAPTKGGASVGGNLMAAAGVQWKETDDGGIVPMRGGAA